MDQKDDIPLRVTSKDMHDQENASYRENNIDDKEVEYGSNLIPDMENRGAIKGDDSDGRVNWTTKRILATLFLSVLYVGSQLPLFFVGGSLSYIADDIGGATVEAWMPISYSLALASIAPFCGYLQDIFGRRNITIAGGIVLCVGILVIATAQNVSAAISGMAVAGAGAAIGELTALAGTAELVPVNKRGLYLAWVTLSVLPFCPYSLYSQLLSTHTTWRWGLWICLIYNGVAVAGIALFYFPKSHLQSRGQPKRLALAKIDFIGAFLSITGLTLFLVSLTAGGFTHPWRSAYVLCTLLIGIFLILGFAVWEWKGAEVPMVPRELFAEQHIVGMAFLISFVAGMYYYALINFFPLTYETVYSPDPVQVGLKGLGPAFALTLGAVAVNALLSVWKGHNRELLLFSAILMSMQTILPSSKFPLVEYVYLQVSVLICLLLAAFGGALATANPENPKRTVVLGTLASFGVGGVLVPSSTIAITVCSDSLIATAISLSLSMRVIGGSIGYAIYYNIFSSKITNKLPLYVGEFAVKAGLPLSSAQEFVGLFLTAPQKLQTTPIPGLTAGVIQAASLGARWAYAESLKYVWYTSIAFGGLSIIACMFLGDISKYMTNRVAADIRRS